MKEQEKKYPSSVEIKNLRVLKIVFPIVVTTVVALFVPCLLYTSYDYLLQGATHTSRYIINNKYVFHTYAYAIENYQCYAEALHLSLIHI